MSSFCKCLDFILPFFKRNRVNKCVYASNSSFNNNDFNNPPFFRVKVFELWWEFSLVKVLVVFDSFIIVKVKAIKKYMSKRENIIFKFVNITLMFNNVPLCSAILLHNFFTFYRNRVIKVCNFDLQFRILFLRDQNIFRFQVSVAVPFGMHIL